MVATLQVYSPPHAQPPVEVSEYTCLGLDLGQTTDHAAGIKLEAKVHPSNLYGPPDPLIRCRYAREWPLGTDYTQIVDDVLDLNPDAIVPEFNGVGRVFVDLLRNRARERGYRGMILPVISAASNARMQAHREARGRHMTVPKVDLVTAIILLQQQKLLRLPDSPEIRSLLNQLRDFQTRISSAARLQFGNAPGQGRHDDLVIALGLAAWWMLRRKRREPAIYMGV